MTIKLKERDLPPKTKTNASDIQNGEFQVFFIYRIGN